MTQADRVLSTPPINTSALPADPTRRRFLTVAAVGSMVGAGTFAAAALTPNDVPKAVSKDHPLLDEAERWKLVTRWRAAMVVRFLTPAPTLAAVEWKKAQLDSRQIRHMGVDLRKVKRAIEADLAFLASHPMRKAMTNVVDFPRAADRPDPGRPKG